MGNSLDSSVQASLDLIRELSSKLRFFIHGNGVIQTESGPVESLKALARRMSSTGYFHPITEVETYNIMIGTTPTWPEDFMVWVYGDPNPAKRGLYLSDGAGGFTRQSYQSIVNLSNEVGRELVVRDVVTSALTGPVDVFKVVLGTDVEGTNWFTVDMSSWIPVDSQGYTTQKKFAVRVNQNGDVETWEAPDVTVGYTQNTPTLSFEVLPQNVGAPGENVLVTVKITPPVNGSVGLNTVHLLDYTGLAYKA